MDKREEIETLDVTLAEKKYKIDGKVYTLKEADGNASVNYHDRLIDAATIGPDGKPTKMSGLSAIKPALVADCLYDEDGKKVPENVIRSWHHRVQEKLYDWVIEKSDLNNTKTALDKAKNEPSGMTGG